MNIEDLAAVAQTVQIPAQFINGSSYPVYAKVKYNDISKYAEDRNKDGVADTYVTGALEFNVTANTSLKAMPWSTVAEGYVSYRWIKKITGVKTGSGGAIIGYTYSDNNEVVWKTRNWTTDIDLRNVQIFYGKQLVNLSTTIQNTEDLGTIESAGNNVVYYRPKTVSPAYTDLNVWVEAEDGQISDYFTAVPKAYDSTNATSTIALKQIADRLAGNIKIYLCMELIDQLGHAETVKLPIRVVTTLPTCYQHGSTTALPTPMGIEPVNAATWSGYLTSGRESLVRIDE